jgi:hypothetical protein
MLHKVMRHGFEFWEAPRNTGPVFEDVDPECLYRAELMKLRRKRFELLTQIVELVTFDGNAECRLQNAELSEREGTSRNAERHGAALAVQAGATRPTKYGKRKEDRYDRSVWGDLAELSDEEPADVLFRMGIPRDEETEERRGGNEPDIVAIQDQVMRMFGVTQQEFFEQNRRGKVPIARAISMALCRAHTNRTAEEIGRAHDRDHVAVWRAVRRVRKLRANNPQVAALIAVIESGLAGGDAAMAA